MGGGGIQLDLVRGAPVSAERLSIFQIFEPRGKKTHMSIQVGDRLPEATFTTMTAEGPKPLTTA